MSRVERRLGWEAHVNLDDQLVTGVIDLHRRDCVHVLELRRPQGVSIDQHRDRVGSPKEDVHGTRGRARA